MDVRVCPLRGVGAGGFQLGDAGPSSFLTVLFSTPTTVNYFCPSLFINKAVILKNQLY